MRKPGASLRIPFLELLGAHAEEQGKGRAVVSLDLRPALANSWLVGLAERALEKMCQRTLKRVAFGRPIAEQTVTLERIAETRILIDQSQG